LIDAIGRASDKGQTSAEEGPRRGFSAHRQSTAPAADPRRDARCRRASVWWEAVIRSAECQSRLSRYTGAKITLFPPAQVAGCDVSWHMSAALKSIAEPNRAAVRHLTALRHHRVDPGLPHLRADGGDCFHGGRASDRTMMSVCLRNHIFDVGIQMRPGRPRAALSRAL